MGPCGSLLHLYFMSLCLLGARLRQDLSFNYYGVNDGGVCDTIESAPVRTWKKLIMPCGKIAFLYFEKLCIPEDGVSRKLV